MTESEEKRKALVQKIAAQESALDGRSEPNVPLPVVGLDDFFDGNSDYGSIGCNLIEEHPGPQGFYTRLREVRAQPNVQEVLIEIYEAVDGEWPFSERVYVLSRAPLAEISAWLSPLYPDEVTEGYPWKSLPAAFPALALGMKIYAAWWD